MNDKKTEAVEDKEATPPRVASRSHIFPADDKLGLPVEYAE